MADVTALQAELDDLQSAYRSGVLRVGYEGKTTEYRSAAEMREAIASLQAAIAAAQGTASPKNIIVRSEKGWQRP